MISSFALLWNPHKYYWKFQHVDLQSPFPRCFSHLEVTHILHFTLEILSLEPWGTETSHVPSSSWRPNTLSSSSSLLPLGDDSMVSLHHIPTPQAQLQSSAETRVHGLRRGICQRPSSLIPAYYVNELLSWGSKKPGWTTVFLSRKVTVNESSLYRCK